MSEQALDRLSDLNLYEQCVGPLTAAEKAEQVRLQGIWQMEYGEQERKERHGKSKGYCNIRT